MIRSLGLPVAALIAASYTNARPACPTPASSPSCSTADSPVDACCVPSPGGLFLFKQRFEPDHEEDGKWGIHGLEVLDCSAQPLPAAPASQSYTHEQVSSFLARHPAFGSDYESWAEDDWADSEVGEGIEEQWERAWLASGRSISTLDPACIAGHREGDEVPLFFQALHDLHRSLSAWTFLADEDITPSGDTSYSRSELIQALSRGGMKPYITCVNQTLSTIVWPLAVTGKFQDGGFVSTDVGSDVLAERGDCPVDGIVYPMAEAAPMQTATHQWDPIYRPSPRPLKATPQEAPYHAGDRDHVDQKLQFFKKSDEGMTVEKERRDEWGMKRKGQKGRDEL